jgi:hypothetical protein
MPDGYKRSIMTWIGVLPRDGATVTPPWPSENGAPG